MIQFIVICALAFYGSKVTWLEGMLFENMKKRLDLFFGYTEKIGEYTPLSARKWWYGFRKPLYACPMCMPSIWGTISYWVNFWDNNNPIYYLLFMWVLSVFAMTATVYVLMSQFPIEDD